MRLDGKISASVDVVSEVPHGSDLGPLLFKLYTSELFNIVGNHIVGYADDATIYAVIPRPLSRPRAMESLNQDLAGINSWGLKWYMRFNPKKTKSTVVSRPQTIASSYGDLTLGGAELEELKSLRILGGNLDSKLTINHLLCQRQPGVFELSNNFPGRKVI